MQALIDKIERAFADVAYPGDHGLTDSTIGIEPAALIGDFRGKTDRKQLDIEFINQAPDGYGTALSFFSANALRFYLPVYLKADIRGELRCFPPISKLCLPLTEPCCSREIAEKWGGGTLGEHVRADFAKFDAAQVSAIVAYLRWKFYATGGRKPEIKEALENYWLERDAAPQN